jgi:putative CRISPR-associated protein (TIGR02620 family)
MNYALVVTRHSALVELLLERRIIGPGSRFDGFEVISHVENPEQIRGKDIIGVLPLSLAAFCSSVTEVSMTVPPEMRGKELSLEQMRVYAGHAKTYKVTAVG